MTSEKRRSILPIVTLLILGVVIIGFIGIYSKRNGANQTQAGQAGVTKIAGTILPSANKIPEFKLTADNGKSFTQENLKGHWSLLFFGFTNCPAICPTTMSELNKLHQQLTKSLKPKQIPQVVMVSVDPSRDSVDRIRSFVKAFNKSFVGVRGEEDALKPLENQLHVIAVKMAPEGGSDKQYTVNHSAELLVVNPQGEVVAYLSYPHKAEQMAKDYKTILRVSS